MIEITRIVTNPAIKKEPHAMVLEKIVFTSATAVPPITAPSHNFAMLMRYTIVTNLPLSFSSKLCIELFLKVVH